MGVFLAIGIFFLYWFISSGYKVKVIIVMIFTLFMLMLVIYLKDFAAFLNKEFGGNFAKTLHVILSNTEQAHNLLERLKDISETYHAILNNNISVGVGLGKGQTIEIWVAMIMYRYGFIGLIFFILYFLFVGCLALFKLSESDDFRHRELLKAVAIWALTIFISQTSGLMLEMSKGAIISCLMFALTARVLSYREQYVKISV